MVTPDLYVNCPRCGTRHNNADLRVDDIREGVQGEDVITFDCPECDAEQVEGIVFTVK